MFDSKVRVSLCLLALAGLSTAGCDSDHPDLKPGDKLGVDDVLESTSTDPIGSSSGGQIIGAPSAAGSGGSGGAGASTAACGNGAIEPPEMCDGINLGGSNCALLGFSGGTLLCDPSTCTFDDSMCLSTGGGTGGTGG